MRLKSIVSEMKNSLQELNRRFEKEKGLMNSKINSSRLSSLRKREKMNKVLETCEWDIIRCFDRHVMGIAEGGRERERGRKKMLLEVNFKKFLKQE